MMEYGSKGGASKGELAAIHVRNPSGRVGLAASMVDLTVGLAANFHSLCEQFWIGQFGMVG